MVLLRSRFLRLAMTSYDNCIVWLWGPRSSEDWNLFNEGTWFWFVILSTLSALQTPTPSALLTLFTTHPTLSGLPTPTATILKLICYLTSSHSDHPPKLICPTNCHFYHPPKIIRLAFFNSYTSDLAYSAHTSDHVCLSTPTSATLSNVSASILPQLPFS